MLNMHDPKCFAKLCGYALGALCLISVPLLIYYSTFPYPNAFRWRNGIERQFFSLIYVAMYVMHFVLFLAPGLAALLLSRRALRTDAKDGLMTVALLSSLIGYLYFWIYFGDHRIGKTMAAGMQVASVFVIWRAWRGGAGAGGSELRAFLARRDTLIPLALMFVTGLFYLGVLLSFDLTHEPGETSALRFLHQFPPDNVLPRMLAERIYFGLDPRPLMEGWLSSDRPPLQAGMVLAQLPFKLMGVFRNYYVISMIYQCLWIPALWSLCRSFGASERQAFAVYLVCLLSGFFLLNSIYVWPKLLAAAFVVWAYALLLRPTSAGETRPLTDVLAAALAAALGYLAHGGVAFTLLAIGLVLLLPRYFPGWKRVLASILVFGTLQVPWMLYQKYYEPPANRLLKWYLADVQDIDSRTTGQALKDAYGSLTLETFVETKLSNIKQLLPNSDVLKSPYHWRSSEFYNTLMALGVLNVAWVMFLLVCISRHWRKRFPSAPGAALLLCTALLAQAVWILVLFGKDAAIIHSGSYATMMLLFAGLTLLLLELPRRVFNILIALHALDFFIVWILTTPHFLTLERKVRALNLPMSMLALAAFLALVQIGRFIPAEDEPRAL